jgi:hypothetical protein
MKVRPVRVTIINQMHAGIVLSPRITDSIGQLQLFEIVRCLIVGQNSVVPELGTAKAPSILSIVYLSKLASGAAKS